jgi:hypothetical protein
VLGDEPLSTTFLADARCLVRWNYAESEEGLLAAVRERLAGEGAWDEELDLPSGE